MFRLLSVIAIACLGTLGANAQIKEGKVVFARKMNMHKDLPPEAEQFKAMMPEFRTDQFELIYNSSQSYFKVLPAEAAEDLMPTAGDGGGRRMNFRMGGSDAETFRDYDKEQVIELIELGPKKYVIEDSLKTYKWKLEDDTLTILGYLCRKATTTQEAPVRRMRMGGPNADTTQNRAPAVTTQKVTVWYSDQLESQAGPAGFFGLPGLILKVDVNEGSAVYIAQSVAASSKALKAPDGGKKITRAEYRNMMEQQMRNMRGPGGRGGGGAQIRVINQ